MIDGTALLITNIASIMYGSTKVLSHKNLLTYYNRWLLVLGILFERFQQTRLCSVKLRIINSICLYRGHCADRLNVTHQYELFLNTP